MLLATLESLGNDSYVPALTPYQGERSVTLARELDGVIVLAGNEPTGEGHWQAAAWGFLPDGSPGPSFGTNGVTGIAASDAEATSQATTIAADGHRPGVDVLGMAPRGAVHLGVRQAPIRRRALEL